MKTYIDKNNKVCSSKPDIFQVGIDNAGNKIYNNDIVYHYNSPFPNIEYLNKDFEKYSKNYFKNTYKIYPHYLAGLLTYLAQLIEDKLYNKLKNIPNIGDVVILRSHNIVFTVLDNKYKLFIKVQSVTNPKYIAIFPIYEFKT